MTKQAGSSARWTSNINHVNASLAMQAWLTDQMSLTVKLMQRCERFRVQRLMQGNARVLRDEVQAIDLPRRVAVQQREVLLRCDEQPVVYAHTVVPLTATASDWPFFGRLGERSLGTTLFGDPRVQRGVLEYARLRVCHPLMRRAAQALDVDIAMPLFARRCLYRRRQGLLLVTEIFLPALDRIGPARE
ncbi:MAG: chorismate lyase [Oxalicibacterium faecigallinarum]|uniref:chorismate--pyruvate lyase family protein n=1 Tax=Oxalicibacterium faecigallinarum TaxID=573741 RepID=UPI0028088C39|nr:chorismate lyase [Oxalicibacterium faecigallinarum]MDQ7969893.1 chorismate lyase [Oxalicibacterium faecigallinarum]